MSTARTGTGSFSRRDSPPCSWTTAIIVPSGDQPACRASLSTVTGEPSTGTMYVSCDDLDPASPFHVVIEIRVLSGGKAGW